MVDIRSGGVVASDPRTERFDELAAAAAAHECAAAAAAEIIGT
jgi:hypothetical protein